MHEQEALRDRIRGCILGAAIGEALGMPVETMSREGILAATGGKGITGYRDGIQRTIEDTSYLPAGSGTDEREIILASIRSLVRSRWFDLESQGAELMIARLQSRMAWGRSMQGTAAEFIQHCVSKGRVGRHPGAPAAPVAEKNEGCGNGVAVRGIPLACFHAPLLDFHMAEYVADALALGSQTHADRRSSVAAVAVGAVIGMGLHERLRPPQDPLHETGRHVLAAMEAVERHDHLGGDSFRARLVAMLDVNGDVDELQARVGSGNFALESVPFAIGVYLRHSHDFRSGVLAAINAGGDTDTVGCLVGAMIGATVGLGGIPPAWEAGLRGQRDVYHAANGLAALCVP